MMLPDIRYNVSWLGNAFTRSTNGGTERGWAWRMLGVFPMFINRHLIRRLTTIPLSTLSLQLTPNFLRLCLKTGKSG